MIHSLNFPSYHACLLAGPWHGMHIPSQFSSAQPISEPKQKDGMTSESLSAETGRQLLLARIRKISYRSTLDCTHPLICHPFNSSLSHFLVCTHGKALFSTYQPAWDRIHNFFPLKSKNGKTNSNSKRQEKPHRRTLIPSPRNRVPKIKNPQSMYGKRRVGALKSTAAACNHPWKQITCKKERRSKVQGGKLKAKAIMIPPRRNAQYQSGWKNCRQKYCSG